MHLSNRHLVKDGLGWGIALWFIGYVLGIILFALVPASVIGWIISPIGIVLTVWVLSKKIESRLFRDYLMLAIIWTGIALVGDYLFLVQLFKPQDGYYKLDVYVYYFFTFVLPLVVGWRKAAASQEQQGKSA